MTARHDCNRQVAFNCWNAQQLAVNHALLWPHSCPYPCAHSSPRPARLQLFRMTVLAAPHATFRDLQRLMLELWLDCGCGHLCGFKRLAEPAPGPWPRQAEVRWGCKYGCWWQAWYRRACMIALACRYTCACHFLTSQFGQSSALTSVPPAAAALLLPSCLLCCHPSQRRCRQTRRQPSSDLLGDVLRLRGERLQHFYDMGDSTFVTIEVRMCWAGGADGGRVDGG